MCVNIYHHHLGEYDYVENIDEDGYDHDDTAATLVTVYSNFKGPIWMVKVQLLMLMVHIVINVAHSRLQHCNALLESVFHARQTHLATDIHSKSEQIGGVYS